MRFVNKWTVAPVVIACGLALALAGCSILKPTDDQTALANAQLAGAQSGNLVCLAIVVKHPEAKPEVVKTAAKIADVLASDDPTLAGVQEALNQIPDAQDRLLAQATVSSLVIVLGAAGHPVPSLDKGSPAYVGLAAFVAACQKAID